MANPIFDLTGKKPADTYRNLVQYNTSSNTLLDGVGNELTASTVQMTASYASTASYAFAQILPEYSSSWASSSMFASTSTSASHALRTDLADQAISAGFATNSTSASHALRTDLADQATSAAFATNAANSTSSSFADTSMVSDSASYAGYAGAFNVNTLVTSASHAIRTDLSDVASTALYLTASAADLTRDQNSQSGPWWRDFGPAITMTGTGGSGTGGPAAGTLAFKVQNSTTPTDIMDVAILRASKDSSRPSGGVGGQISIAVINTGNSAQDRVAFGTFDTRFSGSVIAVEADGNGRSGFTGSLQGNASSATTSSYILGSNVDGNVNYADNAGTAAMASAINFTPNDAFTASYVAGNNVVGTVSSASRAERAGAVDSVETASFANKAADADQSTVTYMAYDIVAAINHTMSIDDTSTTVNNALFVSTVSGSTTIAQSGVNGPPDLSKPVLNVVRGWNYDFQPQTDPLLRLGNYGTGSADPALWIDYYGAAGELRRVLIVDASGSIQGKEFYGTASYALTLSPLVTASWSDNATSASWSDNAMSASWANNAMSASYAPTVTVGISNVTTSFWDIQTSMTASMFYINGLVVSMSYTN